MRLFLAAAILLATCGCQVSQLLSPAEAASHGLNVPPADYQQQVQIAVARFLHDPESAIYHYHNPVPWELQEKGDDPHSVAYGWLCLVDVNSREWFGTQTWEFFFTDDRIEKIFPPQQQPFFPVDQPPRSYW